MATSTFDRFLDWFDKLKYAILGTLLLHLLVIGFLGVWQIQAEPTLENKRELTVDVVDDETMQDLIKLQEELQAMQQAGPVQNATNDMNATVSERVRSNFRPMSSKATEALVEEELRELEQAEFDRLAQERTARGEDVQMPELDKSKWNPENYMPPTKRTRVTGRTTTSYFLEGRGASIPTPAYVCEGAGMVLINISVDRAGRVRSTEVAPSSVSDQCMIDAALSFVAKSAFEPKASAPSTQNGWVKFTFVAQ